MNRVYLETCGNYDWPIFIPTLHFIVVFEDKKGQKRHEVNIANQNEQETLETLLLSWMYPVEHEYHIWIEDLKGDRVPGVRTKIPNFPTLELVGSEERITDPDTGNQVITINRQSSLTHTIHFGWQEGKPCVLEINALFWPPALFFVGNNQIRAFPVTTLNIESMRQLYKKINEYTEEFRQYEEAFSFHTNMNRSPFSE